jgi:16S rRNA (adenine1518-N6/adenine1519-N6)-dimethyltransferase
MKIIGKALTKNYCFLSVLIQSLFIIRFDLNIKKINFWPRPKVDSGILILVRRKKYKKIQNWNLFFFLVKNIFLNRRKMIRNSLLKYSNIKNILFYLKINYNSRADDLNPIDYILLSNELFERNFIKF